MRQRIIILLVAITDLVSFNVLAQQECVGNMPSRDDLVTTSAVTQEETFYLFPSINFTCSVHINGWILAGNETTAASSRTNNYPEIQTWRFNSLSFGDQYVRNSTTGGITPQHIGGGLYQFTFASAIEVMAGDVVAIRIPPSDSTDLLPLFNTSSSGSREFDEYIIQAFDSDLLFLPLPPGETGTMFRPLVAPVIQVVSSTSTISSHQSSPATSVNTNTVMTTTNTVIVTTNTAPSTTVLSSTSGNPAVTRLPTSVSTPLSTLTQVSQTTPNSIQQSQTQSIPYSSAILTSSQSYLTVFSTSIPAVTFPSDFVSSSSIPVSSGPPVINAANNDGLSVSIVASIIVVALLFVVIVVLVIVLVILVMSDKRKKKTVTITADPTPNGYDHSEHRFENPNYTFNVRAKPNGNYSNGIYDMPQFTDPPSLIVYDTPCDSTTSPVFNGGIYDNTHYEFDHNNPSSSSQSHLVPEHYEIPSPTGTSSIQPVPSPVSHYEMEVPSKGRGQPGIYESADKGLASSYEQPVCSRNNTIVRESNGNSQQPLINKYHVLDPPMAVHDYNILEGGSILVPSEEERDWMTEDNRGFDEQAYAKLGIIQKQKYENVVLFEKADKYWRPSTQPSALYNQLSRNKFREILRNHVKIIRHLGSGQFGTVNEGVWSLGKTKVPVAVKLVSPNASVTEKVKLLQEGAIMGQFDHTHIVKLHGVVTVGEPVMIVIELMTKGDLRNRLKQIKQELTQSSPSPNDIPNELLRYCREVSLGMEYLSGKCFIHRDLAARNIFLTEDLTCKIGDFGMSRDLDDENYYMSHGGKIPVKWTAPEALQYKKYSTSSDVWSFGALMYEVWGVGHKPFEGSSNPQTIDLVQSGYRLPPPPGCPRAVYQLMIDCWHPNSNRRPKFTDIVRLLSKDSCESMLSWTNMDRTVHLEASVLGASLEAGQDLYIELQQTYTRSTIRIQ